MPLVFNDDNDRYFSLVSLLFSSIVTPVLKGSIRKHYPGILAIYLVDSIATHIPQSCKNWKKEIIEGVTDPQYFNLTGSLLNLYYIASSLSLDYDPDRLVEFLGTYSLEVNVVNLFRAYFRTINNDFFIKGDGKH